MTTEQVLEECQKLQCPDSFEVLNVQRLLSSYPDNYHIYAMGGKKACMKY